MQSPTQADSGPDPGTTTNTSGTGAEPQPAQREPDAQEKRDNSAEPVQAETLLTPQESTTGAILTVAETHATVTVTQTQTVVQSQSAPSETEGMEIGSTPSAQTEPDTNANPGPDVQNAKKRDKAVRDGRKYVPSKKAMIDPLKMDMSKPLVIPLTSSQLSLQCIECHIIFSDHKSKERHLKSSHPAEYEQCILRNALFACYVCDRHFTNSTELMAHQKAHIEKKPFKCPICSQAFNKSSELTAHKKIHFGQDGYACTDCGKACKTLTLLKYHRRTHTGERPYVCKECGKRFTMSKALQKHIVSHLPEGAEGNEEDKTTKAQLKKIEGASTVKKYSCSLCKATFKSTKTRLHHMKRKHSTALSVEQQVKQSAPIITPISICQPALLQVEPNGPLQKVDANIDTEQICRLIESLGNVQKVNQVVILGQVPPHAPPLEVQQLAQIAEPMNLNLSPPQMDLIELQNSKAKAAEMDSSNNPCDSMQQTIILEPITPDGQLENPSFAELGSHIAAAENIELKLIQSEQTQRPEGEMMHQILQQPQLTVIQPDPVNEMVCQSDVVDLKQDLEQTIILELTPALIPTLELEHSHGVPQNEIPSSCLVPTTELEKTPAQTVVDEQEVNLSVPPLMPTIELELTSLQTEQQDIPSCTFVPLNTFTQTQSEPETKQKEEVSFQTQTVTLEPDQSVVEGDALQEIQEEVEQEPQEKLLVENKEAEVQVENLSEGDKTSDKGDATSQVDNQQVAQISELPVNVMSAQELVKVRKRKPARAFIFQGYMQELVGSLYNDDLHIDAKRPKRKRARKSHLVVRFSPQSKEKKNKKQKTPSQHHPPARKEEMTMNLSETNVASQKKGRKGKIGMKVGRLVSTDEIKTSLTHPQAQENKEGTRKNKFKKQKEDTRGNMTHVSQQKTVASPVFKKKKQKAKILQKNQPLTAKDGKRKKNLAKEKKVNKKTSAASVDMSGPHVMQDSLLLLKGHKQPQLKVYKLDPSKASSQTRDASPHESQQSKDKHPTSESAKNQTTEVKRKGGRPKKNPKSRTLLSSLNISHQPTENLLAIPKTSRKRKTSSKVETEGVITSHSKRALECMDCGETFSEVSSLQKHKAMVHIVESPGLTYTNGNVFEGVSRSDLYHLPKQHEKVVGGMNTATGWDTEPEMGEMALEDRERTVSFPTLIPSPSIAVPPDVDISTYEDKGEGKKVANEQAHTSLEAHSLSNSFENNDASADFTSGCALSTSTHIRSLESGEPLASDGSTQKESSSKSEGQATTDDDIKEDLLLEVDLVTVGEQSEKDDPPSQDGVSQNGSPGPRGSEGAGSETDVAPEQGQETAAKSLGLQNVSCSTQQVQIKEEEEEMLVRNEGETATRKASTSRKQGTENLKQAVISKQVSHRDTVRETESEKEQDECQGGHEDLCVASDSEIHAESETGTEMPHPHTTLDVETNQPAAAAACLPSLPSTLEESPEEQVVFELESVTTSVEEVMNNRGLKEGDDHDRETNQSPGIILEKFLTSSQRAGADIEPCLTNGRQDIDSITEQEQLPQSQEIKVEENISDPTLYVPSCPNRETASVQPQNHQDIRTILVKQEARMMNDGQASHDRGQIRWNVEPVDSENTTTPLMESGKTTRDCCITPEFNTNQCIFYPVKEEEREVLLGPTESSAGSLSPERSADVHQTEPQTADSTLHEGSHPMQDYPDMRVMGLLSEPMVGDSADLHGPEAEQLQPPDLRNFLLQSSDEEDLDGLELSDPHVESEEEIMASYNNNQTNSTQQPTLPASTNQPQASGDENRMRQPIDYFSTYFDWDTWVEIVSCTNKQSKMSSAVTAREVARFVGIHIAMGTLKFPSLRLYWEDLTKVPLIAEAMPLSRFLELSRLLKLASPAKDLVNSDVEQGRHNIDCQNAQQGSRTVLSRSCVISQLSDGQREGVTPNDTNGSKVQTDPLWKVQPLLCRFRAGCQSLKRNDEYAVDQYPLVLTGKLHSAKLSLYCTTLIGFEGFLLHVDLKLDRSDKEAAVEKMVPKGSMVFLCKQELSTPAMLERLLAAGVHGAGRVGGARGQIGDEFVSSDGKLMLRRSHCGFILSTAGTGRRNMASLIDNFEKAQIMARLNRDLLNLYSIPLTASALACWPQAVLWYLTDLALVNSWLLYRQDHKAVFAPLTLMAFRLEVSKALILSSSSDTQDSVPPQPPTETAHATNETLRLVEDSPLPDAATRYDGSGHWPEQLGEGEGGRCRFGDCQRTSRVLCLKCCVFLCISRNHNCFLNFHNQDSLLP